MYELSKGPLLCAWRMTVSVCTASRWRETLPQHNAAVTQNTDGGSALVHFPWSTYLHRWLYSALMCVCVCVWFRVVYFLQVGRCRGCCSGVFWSVIIFRVCSRRSLLPNWGRYFADKPISVSWQKDFQDSGGHRWGSLGLFLYFFCFFVWNGHTIPSLHRT